MIRRKNWLFPTARAGPSRAHRYMLDRGRQGERHRYLRELFEKLPSPASTVSRFSSVARAAAGTAIDTWIRHPLTYV
ncbi:MAG: hypothetical protein OXH96_17750 [Spirochaetaceae bacterium]|nr:hypothetical protein [Spirochaetaceae bacterium]